MNAARKEWQYDCVAVNITLCLRWRRQDKRVDYFVRDEANSICSRAQWYYVNWAPGTVVCVRPGKILVLAECCVSVDIWDSLESLVCSCGCRYHTQFMSKSSYQVVNNPFSMCQTPCGNVCLLSVLFAAVSLCRIEFWCKMSSFILVPMPAYFRSASS